MVFVAFSAVVRAGIRLLAEAIGVRGTSLIRVLLPGDRRVARIRHRLCALGGSITLLSRQVLLRVLIELHLDQVLNHLIEDGRCIVLGGHLTSAIGHVR